MKYLFILISFLSSIQFSLAAEKAYALQSGDASLSVAKDGKRLSLQTDNAHYLSLNAPYVVTLEVNAETLNGYYCKGRKRVVGLHRKVKVISWNRISCKRCVYPRYRESFPYG